MAACTFFGHRDTPTEIKSELKTVLSQLIEENNVDMFFVGNHGRFDSIVKCVLAELAQLYPHISYAVVLAYMPNDRITDYTKNIYPEGLEIVPPKYAIIERNKWMIDKSDFVITYVKHNTGGAAKFKTLAEKKAKIVINIAK